MIRKPKNCVINKLIQNHYFILKLHYNRAMKILKTTLKKWMIASVFSLPIVTFAQTVNVDINKERQLIRGFGGINFPTWIDDLSESQRKTAFENGENQLGISVLRIHVDPEESNWSKEIATAQYAIKQGAYVFASPWNPPSNMTESYSSSKRLKTSSYGAYVQHLNKFVEYMKKNGVDLYAISIQNEPDYGKDWTWWPSNDMATFMANYAGDINCKVMAPESFQYTKSTSDPILNNSKALANLDILATHLYGTQVSQFSYPLFQNKGAGKELWMTEVYYPNSSSDADTWPEALEVADHMTNAMVVGNFQAYVWWYIRRSYGLIKENGNISKRGYCFSHYSKFVRPGYVRVDATQNPTSNVNVAVFKKENDIVIVAVNKNTSSKTITFSIPGSEIKTWERYVTNSQKNVAKGSDITSNGTTFQVTLDAQSANTFIGQGKKGTPKISITSPKESDDLEAPASITISAEASDEDGSIQSVSFYNGTEFLGECTSAPYSQKVENLGEGEYTISAVAKDNEGNEAKTSLTIKVHVPQTPYNGKPFDIPGKIEAEDYDLGGSNIAYYDSDEENKGDVYRKDGVDITSNGNDYMIGWTNQGEWMEYTVNVTLSDTYEWSARVSSGNDNSSFHVLLDDEDITGTIKVPNGGDWDTYTTITGKTPKLKEGKHIMRIVIDGSYVNIDWINFNAESVDVKPILATNPTQPIGDYVLYDATGKKINTITFNAEENVKDKMEKQNLPTGIYILSNEKDSFKIEIK